MALTSERPSRQRKEQYNEEGLEGGLVPDGLTGSTEADWREPFLVAQYHQIGSRKMAINMLLPMPTAHSCPRLAIPALLDQAKDPKPAMAVPPQSNKARPNER